MEAGTKLEFGMILEAGTKLDVELSWKLELIGSLKEVERKFEVGSWN